MLTCGACLSPQAFRKWSLEHYTFFMVKLSPEVRPRTITTALPVLTRSG